MNIMIGDTIVTDDREIGIVESRSGNTLTVRFPEDGNRRERTVRSQVRPLAELVYEARGVNERRMAASLAISAWWETPHWLSWWRLFGYSTGQMRRDSRQKVVNQLLRAGLEISSETDRWSRDDRFRVSIAPVQFLVDPDDDDISGSPNASNHATTSVNLPEPFWPVALGLDPRRELELLHALSESNPVLCLLHVPTEAQDPCLDSGYLGRAS